MTKLTCLLIILFYRQTLLKHNGVFISIKCMPLSRLKASGDVLWSITIYLFIPIISLFSTLCFSLSLLLNHNFGLTLLMILVWTYSVCLRAPRHAVHVQLFATCWEKLLRVFGFVYMCLGRVCVGFVVGALVRCGLF